MSRRLSILIVSCPLLLTACQGLFFWKPQAPQVSAPPARLKLEFHNLEHDGTFLYGRFMVGVEEGKIRLDKRLVENMSVTVESVRTCETQEEVPYIFADYVTRPLTEKYLLILEAGYWYGAELRFPLLDDKYTGKLGPPCIDVEFSLRGYGGPMLTRATFRAHRKAAQPQPEPAPGAPMQPVTEPADGETRDVQDRPSPPGTWLIPLPQHGVSSAAAPI